MADAAQGMAAARGKDIFDFISFFRERGYEAPGSFLESYFRAAAELGMGHEPISAQAPVIKTLFVKDAEAEADFDFDFDDFLHGRERRSKPEMRAHARQQMARDRELADAEAEKREIQRMLRSRKEALEKELSKASGKASGRTLLEEKDEAALRNGWEALDGDMESLLGKVSPEAAASIRMLITDRTLQSLAPQQAWAAWTALKDMVRMAVMYPDWKKIMPYLQKLLKLADTARRENRPEQRQVKLESKLEELEARHRAVQKRIDALVRASSEGGYDGKLVKKMESVIHREKFIGGHNSVQSMGAGEFAGGPDSLDTDFGSLTQGEMAEIRQYIAGNARKFRTRLSRQIRTSQRRTVDIGETCKLACATNGVPLDIRFKRQVPRRAKLLMFLDVSGSCREASELMLFLMHCMKEVFRGGLRTYAFVNSLYDISELFATPDPKDAIQAVLSTVPTRGVYSDYYGPLKEFSEEHASEAGRDSIVIWIGDARNNQNPDGAEFMRALSRRCRSVFWLNTEEKRRWNTGDSVIGAYAPYMDGIYEATNTRGLLTALDGIR